MIVDKGRVNGMRYKIVLDNGERRELFTKVNSKKAARAMVKSLTTFKVRVLVKDTKYNNRVIYES